MECLRLIWMDHGGFCFPTLVAHFQDHHHLPLTKTCAYASLLGFLHCHHPTIIEDGACMLDLDGGCLFPTPLSHRRSFSRSPPTTHENTHVHLIFALPPPTTIEDGVCSQVRVSTGMGTGSSICTRGLPVTIPRFE